MLTAWCGRGWPGTEKLDIEAFLLDFKASNLKSVLLHWNLEILSQNSSSASGGRWSILIFKQRSLYLYGSALLCFTQQDSFAVRSGQPAANITWTELLSIITSEDKIKKSGPCQGVIMHMTFLNKFFLVVLGSWTSFKHLAELLYLYIRTCCIAVHKVILKSDPDRGGEPQLTVGGMIGWG